MINVIHFVASACAQYLDLGTDCGLGTELHGINKIIGGGPARKKDWGWQVNNRFSLLLFSYIHISNKIIIRLPSETDFH